MRAVVLGVIDEVLAEHFQVLLVNNLLPRLPFGEVVVGDTPPLRQRLPGERVTGDDPDDILILVETADVGVLGELSFECRE